MGFLKAYKWAFFCGIMELCTSMTKIYLCALSLAHFSNSLFTPFLILHNFLLPRYLLFLSSSSCYVIFWEVWTCFELLVLSSLLFLHPLIFLCARILPNQRIKLKISFYALLRVQTTARACDTNVSMRSLVNASMKLLVN